MSHQNNNNNFEFLDILNLISFIAQVKNIEENDEYVSYIHTVINTLVNEVQKLHYENDIIIEKLEQIEQYLKEESH